MHTKSSRPYGIVVNRLGDVMAHVPRYQFGGVRKLARDAGVAPSTVSRVVHHQINPSFALVAKFAKALEAASGLRLDPRELVAADADFPTRFVCDPMGCPGCLPDASTLPDGIPNPAFRDVKSGGWVCSAYPHGLLEPRGPL